MGSLLTSINRQIIAPAWTLAFPISVTIILIANFFQYSLSLVAVFFSIISFITVYTLWMLFYEMAEYECILRVLVHIQLSGCRFTTYSLKEYASHSHEAIVKNFCSNDHTLRIFPGHLLTEAWQHGVTILCPTGEPAKAELVPFSTFSGGFLSFIFLSDDPSRKSSTYSEFILAHELSHASYLSEIIIQRFDIAQRMSRVLSYWLLINCNFAPISLSLALILLFLNYLSYPGLMLLKINNRFGLEVLADVTALKLVSDKCLRFLNERKARGICFNDENLSPEENEARNELFDKNLHAICNNRPLVVPRNVGLLPIGVWMMTSCALTASYFAGPINVYNFFFSFLFLIYVSISLAITRYQSSILKASFKKVLREDSF